MNNISIIADRCCGCRACAQTCPVSAIIFAEDSEGFMQPFVDEGACVNCGKCLRVCPVENVNCFHEKQTGYAAKSIDRIELSQCSSGGMFGTFAKLIINEGGVVFGCSVDDDMMPRHTVAVTLAEINSMKGSKYVQSDMNEIYIAVREKLESGIKVLFTGVPCQVAGLRNFLERDYCNLLCVDVICHGVPSRRLYAEYLQWLGNKYGGRIIEFEFRSKKRHQWSLTQRVVVEKQNGSKKEHLLMASLDPYYYNFLEGTNYRESCYQCPYSQQYRSGDITIGDFWGIEKTHQELFDINGVSCVLINSLRGEDFWRKASESVDSSEVDIDDIVKNNGNLREPTKRRAIRDVIYKRVAQNGFSSIPYELSVHARITDRIKNIVPNRIRYKIKFFFNRLCTPTSSNASST